MVVPVRISGVGLAARTVAAADEPDEPEETPAAVAARGQRDFRHLVTGARFVAAVAVGLLVPAFTLTGREPWPAQLSAAGYTAALVVVYLAGLGRGRARRPVPALILLAALSGLPMLQLGVRWAVASGFLAGGVLLVARPARAVPAVVLVCLAAGLLVALPEPPVAAVFDGLTAAAVTAVAGAALFGSATAARLVAEREAEVHELKRRTVAEERRRFSRDMHDLLGLSLSAITLKGELVNRLVLTRPAAAKEELAELLVMSRRALADVRAVAAGYRELSLDDECRAVVDVLTAAGVRVTSSRAGTGDLPPRVAGTLAAVLREGVTNVVRHSSATWCAFSVSTSDGTAWLEIVNDGVGAFAGGPAGSGSGLVNLARRVEALGGRFTAAAEPDGTHRLVAEIPV
ncbi:histidine kinase [Amycolatopsis sp., V23-08]|uniref:Histidine kinase n=1 Tax=Amycolatopsis heterodermiae TaxID=3110235 RepID=A0ABU5RMF0_9PSEU|nr:histidine kinase [Amycolatopsis sp., V23-08]MEA5366980.1 histidine kinase [Amycolatopsis sp., V23-08]